MSDEIIALALGTVLAVGALAYVLYPLFFQTSPRVTLPVPAQAGEESAIRALREIEFDRATGKLSESDYRELRAQYTERAIAELRDDRQADAAPAVARPTAFDIEARVRAYRETRRECERCGLRPEPDALYCSTCGGYLLGSCPTCASPVAETAAAFCSRCGTGLATRSA